ncbi:MAG TPA: Hsp33 family molecular chaperone HslO [Candidatus Avilachnospira avistercoris]|nr:Hsp33 family molecular chaperone HslO [Candidatus Avilachnospira avistercoris]
MFEQDYLIRVTALGGQLRAFFITDRDTVEYARRSHNTSPVVTAALGRLMTGALMMGADMKGEDDSVTLKIESEGPIRGLTVVADSRGDVRGFPIEPLVIIPANKLGKLDVGGAVGAGTLSVIKDMGLKEPYTGQVPLTSGEIAEDLTYYFAASEQIPSAIALGVLMNKENTVRQAGGFMIQLMPGADEGTLEKLEQRLSVMKSVTSCLDEGMKPEDMMELLLSDMEPEIVGRLPVRFKCTCSKERMENAIISIGRTDLKSLIDEGEPVEAVCHFCNTKYRFEVSELKKLWLRAQER